MQEPLNPLAVIAGGPFLMPMASHGLLRKFNAKAGNERHFPGREYGTWLIEGECLFTLICIKDPSSHDSSHKSMLLYDHDTDSLHYLRRNLWIEDCPEGTAMLAHFIYDTVGHNEYRPNLMVFDIIQWKGEMVSNTSPRQRFELIRTLKFDPCSILTLQFVGEYNAVRKFQEEANQGKTFLPHKIKTCICMTMDPFTPMRPFSEKEDEPDEGSFIDDPSTP
eukprot:3932026-Rhodomonas_salina.1